MPFADVRSTETGQKKVMLVTVEVVTVKSEGCLFEILFIGFVRVANFDELQF